MSRVLIVDDEEAICWGLRRLLEEEGHRVATASSAEEALHVASSVKPDVVVMDVRLPGISGLTAMPQLLEVLGEVPIVVITAFGNLQTAVTAFRNGAFDYLPKPFDLDQAATVINRALAHGRKAAPSPSQADDEQGRDELFGKSPAMQEVFKRIALVASTETAVLITGESGTGKELVARAIHRHSRRSSQPFVAVNLASLSPTLIESELFGHAKGAFTGADSARQGVLELGDGGTVLFDETADIPPSVQVKLLRVLEQRELTPVGSARARPVSFRVLAATNKNLREACAAGTFREDLYFRLAVFEIALPALRERVEDIPLLATRFLQSWQAGAQGSTSGLLEETVRELCRRSWPGNVRELRNAVEHGALMARGGPIAPEHLPPATTLKASGGGTPAESVDRAVELWTREQLGSTSGADNLYDRFLAVAEPALFRTVLDQNGGNRAAASETLGIHRATLRKKMGEQAPSER